MPKPRQTRKPPKRARKRPKEEKVAALALPADTSDQKITVDLPRSLQAELRRVGCSTAAIDGNWNSAARKSLDLFNKHAGTKLNVKVASIDALEAVKSKSTRVCPLICEHGSKADGESCVKISCDAGFVLNDNNECVERRLSPTRRDKPRREQVQSEFPRPRSQASGQILCNMQGCRPIARGCRLKTAGRYPSMAASQIEVCN
jgi:hypothetical protein